MHCCVSKKFFLLRQVAISSMHLHDDRGEGRRIAFNIRVWDTPAKWHKSEGEQISKPRGHEFSAWSNSDKDDLWTPPLYLSKKDAFVWLYLQSYDEVEGHQILCSTCQVPELSSWVNDWNPSPSCFFPLFQLQFSTGWTRPNSWPPITSHWPFSALQL